MSQFKDVGVGRIRYEVTSRVFFIIFSNVLLHYFANDNLRGDIYQLRGKIIRPVEPVVVFWENPVLNRVPI